MDGPRWCQTEWNKSKREKQIWYINAYMWNLEKWLRWSYLQTEIETDVENKYMDTKQGRGGMNWDTGMNIYTLLILHTKRVTNENLLYSTGFPYSSVGKDPPAVQDSTCNAGDLGSILGLGRSPGGGHGNPVQYYCLENLIDRGAWWATVRGVSKSQTWLSH